MQGSDRLRAPFKRKPIAFNMPRKRRSAMQDTLNPPEPELATPISPILTKYEYHVTFMTLTSLNGACGSKYHFSATLSRVPVEVADQGIFQYQPVPYQPEDGHHFLPSEQGTGAVPWCQPADDRVKRAWTDFLSEFVVEHQPELSLAARRERFSVDYVADYGPASAELSNDGDTHEVTTAQLYREAQGWACQAASFGGEIMRMAAINFNAAGIDLVFVSKASGGAFGGGKYLLKPSSDARL